MENHSNDAGSQQVDITLHTDGRGLWSRRQGAVKVKRVDWKVYPPTHYRGEPETLVRLHLDGWTNENDGLVYTDKQFKTEARDALMRLAIEGQLPALPWDELNYTEQGMQGGHYGACKEDCADPTHAPSVSMILGSW